jgi:succinate dehydrogenase flavin-adding protein (antitoxin of CptAB toxin-antitoxin module)
MDARLPDGPITPLQKQLFFQASRRSMAEVERILARFLGAQLLTLDDESCRRVLNFLNQSDPDILDWITGVSEAGEDIDKEVIDWLIQFRSEVNS